MASVAVRGVMAALLMAAALVADASEDSSVTKVIGLLNDLKGEVESEGKAEATTYDTFACFCKDTTDRKSTSVLDGKDTIDGKATAIKADTAERESKQAKLKERKARHNELAQELEAETVRCQSEDAELEAKVADLTKAVTSLEGALKKVKGAKPASLAAVKKTIQDGLALADALSLIKASQKKTVDAFLQHKVDPKDPEYKFHSSGVIEILENLLTDFEADVADAEEKKATLLKACGETKGGLTSELDATNEAIESLSADIESLGTSIAENREELITAEKLLKEDQAFLKELTSRCEREANVWDQRSQARANELEAISKALEILEGKVEGLHADVKEGLASQEEAAEAPSLLERHESASSGSNVPTPAFLQASSRHLLRGTRQHSQRESEVAALALLREQSQRLDSPMLSALVKKIGQNPFAKVKQLIQQLIEHILDEAKQEATKKGFCDTEVGKAVKDRDYRFADVRKLTNTLSKLEARKDELELEIKELEEEITKTTESLNEATDLRKQQKEENLETYKKAKEGHQAVKEAIAILKAYYSKGARAGYVFAQQPELDAPEGLPRHMTGDGELSGAYRGNQEQGSGVIEVLEVIASDFAQSARTTEENEKAAAAEYEDFAQTSKADIAGKTRQKEIDEQEHEKTVDGIASKTEDLAATQKLVDTALKTIADLKPVCIDTGMTFANKAKQRDEEIKALRGAICELDPDGAEEGCSESE